MAVAAMKFYEIVLHHDNGQVTVAVSAEDESAARALIMKIEGCPARSILSTKEAKSW